VALIPDLRGQQSQRIGQQSLKGSAVRVDSRAAALEQTLIVTTKRQRRDVSDSWADVWIRCGGMAAAAVSQRDQRDQSAPSAAADPLPSSAAPPVRCLSLLPRLLTCTKRLIMLRFCAAWPSLWLWLFMAEADWTGRVRQRQRTDRQAGEWRVACSGVAARLLHS
jgi:hypothetical protein